MGTMALDTRRVYCSWFFYSHCSGLAVPATVRGKTVITQIVQTIGAGHYMVNAHIFATIHAMKKTLWPTLSRTTPTVMDARRPRDKIIPLMI